jgi:hypothetical protein
MQDSTKQRPDTGVVDSDATSKETLADLEKNKQSSNSESEETARESKVPSPDGGNDEQPNKIDDAGPM